MTAVQDIDKKITATPALGFSIQVDLGAGRTGVLQTALANDCSAAELNGMLDKMNGAADRLRAHYRIEERERDIEILEREQAQHDEDIAAVDKRHVEEQEQLHDHLKKQEAVRTNFLQAKEEAHRDRGARGAYEPKGTEKTQVNAVSNDIEGTKQRISKGQAEHDLTHEKHGELKRRRFELIQKHLREIGKCRDIMARGLAPDTV